MHKRECWAGLGWKVKFSPDSPRLRTVYAVFSANYSTPCRRWAMESLLAVAWQFPDIDLGITQALSLTSCSRNGLLSVLCST